MNGQTREAARDVDPGALRTFIAGRLRQESNRAAEAGHGFGHLPVGTVELESNQPGWTRLDLSENCRPVPDVNFARTFSPDRILADIERQVAMLDVAGTDVLLLMASAWAHDPAFDPSWGRTPRNGRQVGDRLDELADAGNRST